MEPTNGVHQPEEQIVEPATEQMKVAPALLDSTQADPVMTEPLGVAKSAVNGTAITRTPAPERTGQPVIDVSDLRKTYTMGEMEVHALRGASVKIYPGEMVAIMGPSGSGKSTLMNIVGCLDVPSGGVYRLDGIDVSRLTDDKLAEIRSKKIGFVFQSFNLLSRTTALANVELPLVYAGVTGRQRRKRAEESLSLVGLGDRLDHKPNELSGGQQQRVAIARALINRPAMILADEPTGNLDTKTSKEIMELFQSLNRDRGMTIIFVTHDPETADYCQRVIHIRDGLVERDEQLIDHSPEGLRKAVQVL